MHITLRQLTVFESVARQLSYTRAADELHLSQPAVSMQIKQLEEVVGLALFEKFGKKIRLSDAGTAFRSYSQNIQRELQQAEEVMLAYKGLAKGKLNIAVASTVNYYAPRLLAEFHKLYPDIELNLDVTNRKTLLQNLGENSVDIVLMGQPPANLELESEAIKENPLVIISPPDHPLAMIKHLKLSDLNGQVFVMRERGSGTRIAMERLLAEHKIKYIQGMQMTRNEAIKQAVRAGVGLSVVSMHTIKLELETGRLTVLKIPPFPVIRHWHMVYRKGKRLSPSAQAFLQFVRDYSLSETL
ncbi:MAG: LysR substrate-binding domain-containing protein [bacterium]